jgi:VIT1/CCC1 family predicted Fe2+/Mn2+ transporter
MSPSSPDAVTSPQPAEVRRWRQLLANERAEASLYRNLAERAGGEDQQILLGIAEAEERHIAHWEGLLGESAGPASRADLRLRVLAGLARHFGSVFVLALAQRAESRSPYVAETDATLAMAADERIHEEVLRGLASQGRARVSGTFRAAVFGANDGLVSNLALVLGVSGGGVSSTTVLLTGLAGILSGALSMGAGEYVSVRSQRELLDASTPGQGATAALPHLDLEANELALVYRARGMDVEQAQRYADAQLGGHPVDPAPEQPGATADHDVVGTAPGAALSSFAFFASGAAVPVLPFVLGLTGWPALLLATVLVGLGLMFTGAVVGVLSGGPPLARALRQLLIGTAAAATTYGLGLAFGAVLG